MSVVNDIFKRLNESEKIVKKPYGDKPQDGKSEKLTRGKKVSVPKGKPENKYKVEKLKSVNSQAGEIFASDTDKVMNRIGSKEQSDKGKIAKANTTKAERKIKFPYGDKVQKSDSKLIKESDEKECVGEDECNKQKVKECDALNNNKLEESDATPDFINDLKDFLNKYCRQDIKVAELSEDGNTVKLDNIQVNIGADSNLAALYDIVKRLMQ